MHGERHCQAEIATEVLLATARWQGAADLLDIFAEVPSSTVAREPAGEGMTSWTSRRRPGLPLRADPQPD